MPRIPPATVSISMHHGIHVATVFAFLEAVASVLELLLRLTTGLTSPLGLTVCYLLHYPTGQPGRGEVSRYSSLLGSRD